MRIFLNKAFVFSDYLKLSDQQYHHLSRVLRIKVGEIVEVVVDENQLMVVKFSKFQDLCFFYELISTETLSCSHPQITLFQVLPKQDKFMTIIDGVTQCGVSAIYPIITDRSLIKLNTKKKKEKLSRWRRQAEQSAMQSKQISIPFIHPVDTFSNFIKNDLLSSYDLCLVAWEKGSAFTVKSYLDNHKTIKKIGVFVGPEGGISNYDVDCLVSKGFKIMTIGSTIVRVEIAALIVVSQILFFYL